MNFALKKPDSFAKHILVVFAGSTFLNALNLIYQLLVAHTLSAIQFAAFNSLLGIYMIVGGPLGNLQTVTARFLAQATGPDATASARQIFSSIFKAAALCAALTLLLTLVFSAPLTRVLRLPSAADAAVLAIILTLGWIAPVASGALQGKELFQWYAGVAALGGILKLACAFLFLRIFPGTSAALCAIAVSLAFVGLGSFYRVRGLFLTAEPFDRTLLAKMLVFFLPVYLSVLSFNFLSNYDMILVKARFLPQQAATYALAQMAGKIFLFLPSSIAIVLFPRVALLHSQKRQTLPALRRALLYGFCLSCAALLVYNLFPSFCLLVLTGKAPAEAILLGRLFGISMTFLALTHLLIFYLLSIHDLRFLKYLLGASAALFALLRCATADLVTVQLSLCAVCASVFVLLCLVAFSTNGGLSERGPRV